MYDMVICVENSMEYTKKLLLQLISEFRIVAENKKNIQKSVVFLYTNKEKSEIFKNNAI